MSQFDDIFASAAAGIIARDVFSNWLSNWLQALFFQPLGRKLKKLLIRNKRHYILWTHYVIHYQRNIPLHDTNLANCQDHPCDLLRLDSQDLGLPGKTPVVK